MIYYVQICPYPFHIFKYVLKKDYLKNNNEGIFIKMMLKIDEGLDL